MTDLTTILLHTFPQPENLTIFNFDHALTVYDRLATTTRLESPTHVNKLLELLERDPALAETFWPKFRQKYPRRMLAWPVAPKDEADWARQTEWLLRACAALVEATMPLNDRLLEACWLWPLRLVKQRKKLLFQAGIEDDDDLDQWASLCKTWPADPFIKAQELTVKPKGLDSRLQASRTMFIAALADRLARQVVKSHDYAPYIAEIVTQIETAWPTDWQSLCQIVKVNEPEPVKPDEPPAPEVTMMRIGADLFLGRKMEQAQFRQVLTHMTTQPISKTATPKLFHFYGHGGMGKTQMTRCLEQIAQTEFQWTVYRYDWQRLSDKEMLPRTLDPFDLTALALTTLAEAWLEGTDLSNFQQAIARYHAMHERVRQSLSQMPFDSRFAPLRDYNPREVATMSQDESAPHHQLAQRFLERELAQEWLTFVSPWIPCAEALGQALQRLPQPTLFIWDTYELVDLADRWLRQIISSSQGRVVWVVAGRNNLSHSSADRTLAGYNDIFETYAYAMPDLQAQEVQSYFNDRLPDQPLNLTEAKQITEAVAGIPLLIKLVADEWRQGIPWAELIADLPRPTAPIQATSNSAAPLISTMFARLLRHVRRHSLEERALYLLAMQPHPSEVWQKPMLASPDFATFYDLGQWLTTRFSHVLPANNDLLQLHDIAYEYIRAHIMRHDAHNPLVATLARQAAELCQAKRAELEQQANLITYEQRVNDETWRQPTMARVEWLFWVDEAQAWPEFYLAIIDLSYQAWPQTFMESIQSLTPLWTKPHERELWQDSTHITEPRLHALTHFAEYQLDSTEETTRARLAILVLRHGEWLTEQKQNEPSWVKLCEAETLWPYESTSWQQKLGQTIYQLSRNFTWPNGPNSYQSSTRGLEIVQKAVAINKQNANAWYDLGLVYSGMHQFEQSLNAYQQAVNLDPTISSFHGRLGNMYRIMKRYDEAITAFQHAIQLDPKNASNELSILSLVYYEQKQYNQAIMVCQQAIQLDPQNSKPHYYLGNVYRALKQYDNAITAYQQSIQLNPTWITHYDSLGNTYRDLKQYDQAIAAYQKAIQLNPQYSNPHYYLGIVYTDLKQYDQAIVAYQQAIQLNPIWATPHNDLGNVYYTLKQYEQAIATYQQAIQLNPTWLTPHNDLGNVYRHLKQYDYALAAYQQAIVLEPNNHWRHNSLALTYAMMNEWEQALITWQKAIELEPNNAGYHGTIANCLKHLSRHDEAVSYLTRAYELMEKESNYSKACIMAIAGNVMEALAYLHEAKVERDSSMNEWVKDDPDLESLHGLAEFWDIVEN